MAIHPSFPEMSVSVVAEGHPLPEHEDRDATPDHEELGCTPTVRYLEVPGAPFDNGSLADSGVGQDDETVPFQIHADVHGLQPESYAGFDGPASERGEYGLAIYISVDGDDVDSLLIYSAMIQSHYANGKTCISRGQYITADSVLPYRFKTIKLIDAAAAATRGVRTDAEKAKLEQLGKVKICVYHVRKQGLAAPAVASNFQDKSIHGLDEVDLKGKSLSHSIGFGEAIPDRGAAALSEVEHLNLENGPVAIYEFRYGSRDALKKAHVIPRTPSPEPEDPDADVHNMTREELIASALATRKREREQNVQTMQIKQEIMDAEGGPINRGPIITRQSNTVACISENGETFHDEPLPESLAKRQKTHETPATIDCDEGDAENHVEAEEESLFMPEGQPNAELPEQEEYDYYGEFQRRFGHNLDAP